jgi:hypothetical protein
LALAFVIKLLILGTDAIHRGLLSELQVRFSMSKTSSAVTLGSTLTGLSSGACGALTSAHWSMIVPSAQVGLEKVKRTPNNIIVATVAFFIFSFIVSSILFSQNKIVIIVLML